jgi:hypothetical protein
MAGKQTFRHGGPRKAGPGKQLGRPPVEEPKVSFSGRCSQEVRAYLDTRTNISTAVEQAIRKSGEFRAWAKQRR